MSKLLFTLLLFLSYSFSSQSVKSLVTSLLMFEEGTNPQGVCVPYIDSRGYPTIGYGQLCAAYTVSTDIDARNACSSYANGCTAAKAKQWLSNEIDQKTNCITGSSSINSAYNKASDYRKAIITSMAYQMGCDGLAGFTNTLNLMANGQWESASKEMLNSRWASQTPERAQRHSYVIRYNDCGNFCGYYGW